MRPLTFPVSTLIFVALLLLSSCAGLNQSTAPSPAAAPSAGPNAVPKTVAQSGSASTAAEMDSLFQKASDAIDSNHLAEAIRSYVAILALYDADSTGLTKDRADRAATELAKIGGRLTLEPGSDWVDATGTQTAGSTRSIGKPEGRLPSVNLFENFGTGKSPVADAPIFFQFIKNTGSMVAIVTTDAFGKANTNLASLREPGSEAVIRAYPQFTVRGKTFVFSTVFRDFSYLPPANVARVFALATSELGTSDNPQILDSAVSALGPTGLQLAPFNGKLAPDRFRRAFGGDVAALGSLGVGTDAPYAAFVLVEVQPVRQMVLNGVTYNIFTAVANVTFRLVRSDGTAVLALPLDPIKGQGGSRDSAVADAYRRAAAALVPALNARIDALKDALATP